MDLAEIARIGTLRAPNEACGILIRGNGVLELPNRSPAPESSYVLNSRDVEEVLDSEIRGEDVAIWHTHPRGLIGPSEGDMKDRLPDHVQMLVVALTEDGPVPAWF